MTDLRIPPHSDEAENGVIGGVLLGTEAMVDLVPEEFYTTGRSLIWQAICGLQTEGVPADMVTVIERLRKRGELEAAGGAGTIAELTGQVPSAARVEHYAKIIKDAAARRSVLTAARQAIDDVFDGTLEAGDILANLDQSAKVNEGKGPRKVQAVLKEVCATMEAAHKNQVPLGLESGFYDLDSFSRGHPCDLIVVAGRPGMGKSALGMDITRHNVLRGKSGLVVTPEMSDCDQLIRAIAAEARVSSSAIREGKLKEDNFGPIWAAAGRFNEAKLEFFDRPAPTVHQVRRVAAKISRSGLDFIVVDYLQLMKSTERRKDRHLEIGDISAGLKGLAKELRIPVYALAQLNRDVDKRNPPIPELSDLRESGAIEQDADTVWMLYRPEAYLGEKTPQNEQDKGYLYVRKQRHGRLGQVELRWDGEHTSYRNMDRRGY